VVGSSSLPFVPSLSGAVVVVSSTTKNSRCGSVRLHMFDKLFRRSGGKGGKGDEKKEGGEDDAGDAVAAVGDGVDTSGGGSGGNGQKDDDGDEESGDKVEVSSIRSEEEARLLAFSAVATAMAEEAKAEEAKAEEEAKAKAEEEAKAKAEEEAKVKAEEEAKAKAEEEAKVEEEAKAKAEEEAKSKAEEEAKVEVEAKAKSEEEAKAKAKAEEKEEPPKTALTKIEELRAQAKRVRLEAERMDVILTLDKISKIEKELASPKVMEDTERREVLQGQMKELKKKLGGDDDAAAESGGDGGGNVVSAMDEAVTETKAGLTMTDEELRERVEEFEKVPKFLQKTVAGIVGTTEGEELNATDVVLRMFEDEKLMAGDGASEDEEEVVVTPATQEEIDDAVKRLELFPKFIKKTYKQVYTDDADLARFMIEKIRRKPLTDKEIDAKRKDLGWLQGLSPFAGGNEMEDLIFFASVDRMINDEDERLEKEAKKDVINSFGRVTTDGQNSTGINAGFLGDQFGDPSDNLVEGCYPKETRREGEEPSQADAETVVQDVSKNNTWAVSGVPVKVPGGFIIRGTSKYENGDDLTAALEANMATSRARSRVSIFYVSDPTPVTEEQMENQDRPPVLFVMGPTVVSDLTPLRNGFVSTLGVVTLWASAIYPILGNEKYMKMVNEQISFADGSMSSNLDFINDMAFPIFTASLVIHFAHEAAHKFVADKNEMKIGFPTFIPSLITGITGAITKLEAPPKNKQALLDFAIVGPLAGIAVSLIYIYIGTVITASTGAEAYANLPSLSLAVLRQSSLAGGIMDAVSPGILDIPDSAGAAARSLVDVMVPLHPLAIAGYFGLMVNAANLLPLGRTDGGRVGLALFGRTGMQVAGFTTSVALVIQGIFYGSDLLLFYFSFAAFFQNQLDIPSLNEVDDVDFSRVLLATAAGFVVLLTLIPM